MKIIVYIEREIALSEVVKNKKKMKNFVSELSEFSKVFLDPRISCLATMFYRSTHES